MEQRHRGKMIDWFSPWASQVAQTVKNLQCGRPRFNPGFDQGDLLEEGMSTHSSILAWKIPWTEEPGGL